MGSGAHLNNSMEAPQLGLKEAVEAYTQEHDIWFFPIVGRTDDGLQVYGFRTVSVYLDYVKQQVFSQSRDRWVIVCNIFEVEEIADIL